MAIYTLEQYKADVPDADIQAKFKNEDLTLFDITPSELSYYISFIALTKSEAFGRMDNIAEYFGHCLNRLQNLLIEMRQKKEELSYLSNENSRCKQAVEKHINHYYGNRLEFYQHTVECYLALIESRERVELKNKQNNV